MLLQWERMPSTSHHSARFSFLAKASAAAALIALADFLFFDREPGWTIGLFALAWTAAVALTVPQTRRGLPLLFLAGAAAFGLIIIEDPGLLAWLLFWVCLSVAVLLPRLARIENALRMAIRLFVHWASSAVSAPYDLLRLPKLRRRRRGRGRLVGALALPILGGLVFLMLFASANPLIEQAFTSVNVPEMRFGRGFFWALVLLAVWPSFRPRRLPTRAWPDAPELGIELPGVSVASVTISLVLFNAIFAIQNGLDVAILWGGAALPDGMTLAEYAHRGAYPLILTALLAGLFVLVTMRPGTDTAASPVIRRLVLLWVAQNLLLVASSMLRTIDYIEVYSLTELRIAALIWMGLVALGLVLICWRLFRMRSGSWLINANALAALAVLSAATLLDLGSMAAQWNVRHAREVGGRGAPIDLCYLDRLEGSALLPLIELERRPWSPAMRDRIVAVREDALNTVKASQADWRQWTWRGARRLSAAEAALGPRPAIAARAPFGRYCGGARTEPPPTAQELRRRVEQSAPSPVGTAPLTAEPRR